MPAKPRVHEVAADVGVESKIAMQTLKSMGVFVKGPSSSIEAPVARRLREALADAGYPFPSLRSGGAEVALSYANALPRRLPQLIDFLLQDHRDNLAARILAQASADRRFYFVPGRAHADLTQAASEVTELSTAGLGSPTGLAIVESRGTSWLLLGWSTQPSSIDLVSATLSPDGGSGTRLSVTGIAPRSLPLSGGLKPATRPVSPVRILAALWSVVPERLPPAEKTSTLATHRDRHSPTEGGEQEETRLIYATRSTLGLGSRSPGGAQRTETGPRTTRWKVSGHYRNQWRPSVQDHERIWIEEHTAGATDGVLQHRDRVYLIAPRTHPSEQDT
ncbi:hypothetical protein DVJ78_18255 (plasmid) [Humibacter sp. BT305]|nr:hypothetical protein DVJ78_18255 [Humibacter sp. BT305]